MLIRLWISLLLLAQAQTPLEEQCAALLPPDRPMPAGENAPAIRFLAPIDGSTVYGSEVALTVETLNFDLNSEARHWHLWIDGTLAGMVYQSTAIIDLQPGTHWICASMGDTDHADIGKPAALTLTVSEPLAGQPTPTLPAAREEAPVIYEPAPAPTAVVLIALGLLAAVGGWWIGARLGKKRP